MAERNQLKIAELDIAADDPFAELTRIMGFDPRRHDPAPAGRDNAPKPVETSVEEDFGIDLEQELMGELQAGYGDPEAAGEAPDVVRADDTGFDAAFLASDGPDAGEPNYGDRWASWRSPVSEHAEDAHIDLAAGDLAEEFLAEEFEADQVSGAGTGHEFPALSLDVDELAKEFAQALEYGGDGEDELGGLDHDLAELTGDPMPSAAGHADDAVAGEFRSIDLAGDGHTGDWPADQVAMDTDRVEDTVAFPFDRAELADDPASTAARMPLHEEDASAFEAAPAEFVGDAGRPAAWREADDGPEEPFSEIDPAQGEPFDYPSRDQPADTGLAGEEPPEADAVLVGYDYYPDPENRGEQASESASQSGEHADPLDGGEFADDPSRSQAVAFGETEQWPGDESSSETEADGFSRAVDHLAPADATPDPAWDQAYASDEAGEPGAADASRLEPESSDVPFEDQEPHAAADEASVRLDSDERPDEFAADVATDDPLGAAPAVGAEAQPAPEFSLEDELNALLGNIKAVSSISAAPVRAWSRAGAWSQGHAAPASTDDGPVPPADGPGSEYAAAGAAATSSPPQDELPGLDDEALELALAGGLDGAGHPAPAPASDGPAGQPGVDQLGAIAADYLTEAPASWDRHLAGAMADAEGAPEAFRAGQEAEIDFGGAVFEAPPAIETVEVVDRPVALADDLDLPELDFQETEPPAAAYDDLDAEFASLLNDMNAGEPAKPPAAAPQASAWDSYGAYGLAPGAEAPSEAPPPRTAFDDAGRFDFEIDELHRSLPSEYHAGDDYPDAAAMVPPPAKQPQRPRRGVLLASIVGAVALAGGVGAFALSFGGSGSNTPALVKADASPVKVKPENPGGTTVPNQDKAVYETVAGAARTVEPQQEKLVTTAEEPIDVSPPMRDEAEEIPDLALPEDEMMPATQPKSEDRIAQIVQQSEAEEPAMAAVAPRKVRTMIVRPDGTLVPREEPADEPALVAELADAAAQATLAAATPAAEEGAPVAAPVPDVTQEASPADTPIPPEAPPAAADAAPLREADAAPDLAVSPDSDPDAGATVTAALGAELTPGAEAGSPVASAEAPETAAAEAERPAGSPVMPEIAPIAPQRPAEQPIDVVGEVRPARVAALAPAAPPSAPAAAPAAAAPAGTAIWSVQIASQPNEAVARSTYQNLASRYASVLQGRAVNIVKAEIEGKGTFWRVRVPTDSRSEAVRLCESYKEAGGNCFVSR